MKLGVFLYKALEGFPDDELFYGLTSQIKRSAVSIPSNIAEGVGRLSKKEFIRFLCIARGSLGELLDIQVELAKRLGFFGKDEFEKIQRELEQIGKMLNGLLKS